MLQKQKKKIFLLQGVTLYKSSQTYEICLYIHIYTYCLTIVSVYISFADVTLLYPSLRSSLVINILLYHL